MTQLSSTSAKNPLKVLYICTHNRCRSALSEAITNQNGSGNLIAKSAGSAPSGKVHPLTLKYLEEANYKTDNLTSNSWDDGEYMDGFEPDVLITVCDNAAGESCPVWLGSLPNLTKLHWGLADPSKDTTDEAVTASNFAQAIATIEARVEQLQRIASLTSKERKQALQQLTQ